MWLTYTFNSRSDLAKRPSEGNDPPYPACDGKVGNKSAQVTSRWRYHSPEESEVPRVGWCWFRIGSKSTPWKINMEPETDGLEDDFPFQLGDF